MGPAGGCVEVFFVGGGASLWVRGVSAPVCLLEQAAQRVRMASRCKGEGDMADLLG